MNTKTPAVAYYRMSSDMQETSPQQQREEIETLAAGKYEVLRIKKPLQKQRLLE